MKHQSINLKLLSLLLGIIMLLSAALTGCGDADIVDGDGNGTEAQSSSDGAGGNNGGNGGNGGNNGGTSVLPGDGNKPTTASSGLQFTLNADGVSYAVTGVGTCTDSHIVVPATYEGKPVTVVGENAFNRLMYVLGITLPNSIKTIESNAFYNCSVLYMDIPEGVTEIKNNAFTYCQSMFGVTIPSTVTTIGENAFKYCYLLVEICNNSSLTMTAESAEHGEIAMYAKNIYSGSGTKLVEKDGYIFYSDSAKNEHYLVGYQGNETVLKLPADINGSKYEIHRFAMRYLKGVTSIEIADCVTSIPSSSFDGNYKLFSITLGTGITEIEFNAFSDCPRLVEVCNKSSLDGYSVKNFLSSIKNIYTPTSGSSKLVTEGDFVFYVDDASNGYLLLMYTGTEENLTLPETVGGKKYKLGECAFFRNDVVKTVTLPSGITEIPNNAFNRCLTLESIIIPEGVTNIGYNAFINCPVLKSIVIPKSVKTVGYAALNGNTNKYDVYYAGSESEWGKIDLGTYNDGINGPYFYSESQPASAGNLWHYVNNVPTKW